MKVIQTREERAIELRDKKMTPREAIKVECRQCKNGKKLDCESQICKLNDKDLSPLKRIKAHCMDCVGTRAEVSACSGNVLNPEPHKCSLWEYRFGKNPNLKGKGNISNLIFIKNSPRENTI